MDKHADNQKHRKHARIAQPQHGKRAGRALAQRGGRDKAGLNHLPAAKSPGTIADQTGQHDKAQEDLHDIGQGQGPQATQEDEDQVSGQHERDHQPQRGAQETGHDERHGHDVHGHEAGHANQGRNAHHQPGPGIKPHFQPFGQRVGAGPPDVRAGKNAEQTIADDQGQTRPPDPAHESVLDRDAGNNAGHTAGKSDPTDAGNARNEADLTPG